MQTKRIALSAVTVSLSVLIFSILLTQNYASAQTVPSNIPSWFHYKAMLWANGQISDQDFLNAIQELTSGQSNSSYTNSMQGMSGMGSTSQTPSNGLVAAMGQMIYCNDIQGMVYNPQTMSGMANCNTSSMSGMGGMPGTSSVNNLQGIPTSVSNCLNTQNLPGQSSQCNTGPSLFDEIASNMVSISSMFTLDAYTQGMMNAMSGTSSALLSTPDSLADLAEVLSSGNLTIADYDQYFTSPARDITQVSVDMSRHASNCGSENFPNVNWEFCNHSGENLDHAHLSHANLIGADLSNTNLYKSDLVQANLDFANLANAKMENTDFSTANMAGAQFIGTDASWSDFNFVNMNGANMTNANLQDNTMRWANMERVSFQGADLDNTLFMNSDLRGADFRGASLQGTGFAGADLTGANFNGDNLRSVDLGSAILTGAQLHCINNPVCN